MVQQWAWNRLLLEKLERANIHEVHKHKRAN